jgi:hypothetical protein
MTRTFLSRPARFQMALRSKRRPALECCRCVVQLGEERASLQKQNRLFADSPLAQAGQINGRRKEICGTPKNPKPKPLIFLNLCVGKRCPNVPPNRSFVKNLKRAAHQLQHQLEINKGRIESSTSSFLKLLRQYLRWPHSSDGPRARQGPDRMSTSSFLKLLRQ